MQVPIALWQRLSPASLENGRVFLIDQQQHHHIQHRGFRSAGGKREGRLNEQKDAIISPSSRDEPSLDALGYTQKMTLFLFPLVTVLHYLYDGYLINDEYCHRG